MIDLDEICVTNINRQLHAMDGEIGRQKTAAMETRVRTINPDCEVVCLETFFSHRNAGEILARDFDYVIDAIDQVKAKTLLLDGCRRGGVPVVCCGGAGGLRDPAQIKIDDLARCHNDSLLNRVRTELRRNHGYPAGPASASKRKAKRFGIDCVFSPERPVYQQCDGGVSEQKPGGGAKARIDCASGLGSCTHMTATFGFFAVSRCLKHIGGE